jgi:hypothetical protein
MPVQLCMLARLSSMRQQGIRWIKWSIQYREGISYVMVRRISAALLGYLLLLDYNDAPFSFACVCSFPISVSSRFPISDSVSMCFFPTCVLSHFRTYHDFTLSIFASRFSATTCESSTMACDFRLKQGHPLFRASDRSRA